jgi:hypothetical protein
MFLTTTPVKKISYLFLYRIFRPVISTVILGMRIKEIKWAQNQVQNSPNDKKCCLYSYTVDDFQGKNPHATFATIFLNIYDN